MRSRCAGLGWTVSAVPPDLAPLVLAGLHIKELVACRRVRAASAQPGRRPTASTPCTHAAPVSNARVFSLRMFVRLRGSPLFSPYTCRPV